MRLTNDEFNILTVAALVLAGATIGIIGGVLIGWWALLWLPTFIAFDLLTPKYRSAWLNFTKVAIQAVKNRTFRP